MNEANKRVTSTTKPATPIPSQFAVGPPKAAPPAQAINAKPQPTQTQPVGRTVRFEVEALKASSVSVVGTFNDWKPGATPLSSLGGGRWARELSLASGRYEYRFIVDSRWVDDPKAKVYVPNPHGGRNAVVEV